jgi:LPS-assembly protein
MVSADIHYKRYFVLAGSNQVKTDPLVSPPANQFRAQFGYGDPNRKGWNAAFSTIYDFRLQIQEFAIAQITYNTDCCGFSVEYRRFNFGARDDTSYRFALSIANIGTFGNLRKQERLF